MKNGDAPVIFLQEREDGGLRVWSDDEPGLILSHRDPNRVLADIFPAIRALRAFRAERDANSIAGGRG